MLSPDTIVPDPKNPQSLNRYSYVLNNPLNYTDPTGHSECGVGQYHCPGDEKVESPTRIPVRTGIEIIILPSGYTPEDQGMVRNQKLSTVLGWGGVILDAGEALASAAGLPVVPEALSVADVLVSVGGSYFAGELGSMKLHSDLPEMFVVSQDVLWTTGELLAPSVIKAGATVAGLSACGLVCGVAGYEFGNVVDVGTSYASVTYDASRMLGITPNKIAIGFYMASANTRIPILSEPGQPTIVLIIYGE